MPEQHQSNDSTLRPNSSQQCHPLDFGNVEIYKNHWEAGVYNCAQCGNALFPSDAKFDSGTAWPSFRKAVPNGVSTELDTSYNMIRTELLCAHCQLHLGHIFEDGEYCGDTHPEAGLRYCILSSALNFAPKA